MTPLNDFTKILMQNGFNQTHRDPSTRRITYFSPTKRDALGDAADKPAEDGTLHGFINGESMVEADENGNVSEKDYPVLYNKYITQPKKNKRLQLVLLSQTVISRLVEKSSSKEHLCSLYPETKPLYNFIDYVLVSVVL